MIKIKTIVIIFLLVCIKLPLNAQLKLGSAQSEVNFREGPGANFKISNSINNSNLLVILPREPQNGYIEVFDIETSAYGFVYESLIQVTDTLNYQKQYFFEKSGENELGDVEIDLINRTEHVLYVWINSNSYNLSPHEKKTLITDDEDITYFSSAPGLFPVCGKEILKRGNTYQWNFSM
jgi:hypothetical protein